MEIYTEYKKYMSELPPNDSLTHSRYVYLVYNQITKSTKIGFARDMNHRLSGLQNGAGVKLYILLVLELGDDWDDPKDIEKFLHKYFKHKRTFGEWFNLSIRDIVEIRGLFMGEIIGYDLEDNIKKYWIWKN